jgi:hypothetical protein
VTKGDGRRILCVRARRPQQAVPGPAGPSVANNRTENDMTPASRGRLARLALPTAIGLTVVGLVGFGHNDQAPASVPVVRSSPLLQPDLGLGASPGGNGSAATRPPATAPEPVSSAGDAGASPAGSVVTLPAGTVTQVVLNPADGAIESITTSTETRRGTVTQVVLNPRTGVVQSTTRTLGAD